MPIFDDQFTLLYEYDTLQLMHFINGNILHCVCYEILINIKLSPLQHCLRRIQLSGTPLTLRERINYFGEKGSRYSLPPPKLLETGENSFSSVFLAFFLLHILASEKESASL